MSALAGTSSPKPNLLSVRSPWLFEMLTKGHVCHVRVNKRPVIPTCFVSVTLSAGRCTLFCLSGPVSNQLNQQQPFGTGAGVTGELWHCLLSFPMLSAPTLVNGRTLATLLSIVEQPTGTHRNSISPMLLFDMLRVNCTYPDTLSCLMTELPCVL